MTFSPTNLAALIIAACFAAGLNVYATLLTLGLLAHAQWIALPSGLEMLGSWWVIGVSGVLFAAEFVADKTPGLDLLWNGLHTFVRVPIAALLAYGASGHLSPPMQLVAAAMGAAVAMIAHSSKTAARAVVSTSPEPLSNITFSMTEDFAAVGITWLATLHPWAAASVAIVFMMAAFFMVRWVIRVLARVRDRRLPLVHSKMASATRGGFGH